MGGCSFCTGCPLPVALFQYLSLQAYHFHCEGLYSNRSCILADPVVNFQQYHTGGNVSSDRFTYCNFPTAFEGFGCYRTLPIGLNYLEPLGLHLTMMKEMSSETDMIH